MKNPPFTFAVTSLKPHAGRTTGALALAWALGRAGHRVLVVDANQYASVVPRKSKTGSPEIWDGVIIGSRKAGEAERVGAEIVVIDAPPLTGRFADDVLRLADAVLVSVFPIAQNKRFMADAKALLETVEPERVFGWSVAKINAANQFHTDLAKGLEASLAAWTQRTPIPESRTVPDWDWYAGEEPPEGPVRDAYLTLAEAILPLVPPPGPRAATSAPADDGPAPRAPRAERARPEKRKQAEPAAAEEAAPRAPDETIAGPGPGDLPPEPEVEAAPAPPPAEPAAPAPAARSAGPGPTVPPASAPTSAPAPETEPGPALPAAAARKRPRRGDRRRPSRAWRLLADGRPRASVALVPSEGRIKLPEGMRTLPETVPASAVRALLRFGWIHGLVEDVSDDDASPHDCHPISSEPPSLPPANRDDKKEPLRSACRALLEGDPATALVHLEEEAESADARFLAGILRLANDEHLRAPRDLQTAVLNASTLGVDLARQGLAAHVSVQLAHGVSTHFGTNLRGARLGLTLAYLASGDEAAFLAELDELVTLEPDDLLLRALRVEWILDSGSMVDLEVLHRSMLQPSYETPIHMMLAFYRAQTLHRLGLPDTASLALREAQERVPQSWSSLQRAIEIECQDALETLARVQRVRNDLEGAHADA